VDTGSGPPVTDSPVVIFAPLAADAATLAGVVTERSLEPVVCTSPDDFSTALARTPLCVLVTEEAITASVVEQLGTVLDEEPPWSTMPFVFIVRDPDRPPAHGRSLLARTPSASIVMLPRPVKPRILSAAIDNQVRLRRRQLQTRQLLIELEEARNRNALLLSELKHRTSNTLSIARAMVRLSAEQYDDVAEYADAMAARLGALADANERLTDLEAEGASIRSIVAPQVEAHCVSTS